MKEYLKSLVRFWARMASFKVNTPVATKRGGKVALGAGAAFGLGYLAYKTLTNRK